MWENFQRVIRCKNPWGGKITFSCTLLGSVAGALQMKDIIKRKSFISHSYGECHINDAKTPNR